MRVAFRNQHGVDDVLEGHGRGPPGRGGPSFSRCRRGWIVMAARFREPRQFAPSIRAPARRPEPEGTPTEAHPELQGLGSSRSPQPAGFSVLQARGLDFHRRPIRDLGQAPTRRVRARLHAMQSAATIPRRLVGTLLLRDHRAQRLQHQRRFADCPDRRRSARPAPAHEPAAPARGSIQATPVGQAGFPRGRLRFGRRCSLPLPAIRS